LTTRHLTGIVTLVLIASCTGASDPPVSAERPGSPPNMSSSVAPSASAPIDLPWLPPQGVVVQRHGGIVFVAMDGSVRAKLDGFELIDPTEAPGVVLVRRGNEAFVLDAAGSMLHPVEDERAKHLHVADREAIDIPTPPGMIVNGKPSGHWRFAILSPDGNRILAQWSGECEVPIAYVVTLQSGPPVPVTGESSNVSESIALGWTRGDRALIWLPSGACAPGARQPGVYAFDASGRASLVTSLPRFGLARMWGSRWIGEPPYP
jgi:hypothetical protein